MSDDLRPLPPDIEALLHAERDAAPPSDVVRARVGARIRASIAAGGATVAMSKSAAAKSIVASKATFGGLAAKLIAITAVSAIGTLGTIAVYRHTRHTTETRTRIDEPARPSVMPPSAPAAVEAPAIEPTTPPAIKTTAPVIEHRREQSSHLREEQALLAAAHDALAADDPSRALVALERHAHRFPNGQLAEERACLRVRALFASGDKDEAARAQAEFGARYPESMFPAATCGGRDGK